MAIRKMKFVSIVGELDHFDGFVARHIIDSNLHPENALNVFSLARGIMPFPNEESKSDQLIKLCVSLMDAMQLDYSPPKLECYHTMGLLPLDAIESALTEIGALTRNNADERAAAAERQHDYKLIKENLVNISNVNINVELFFNLEFIKFRFGKLPKPTLKPLEILAEELDMIILPLKSDENYSWLFYFTPSAGSEKIDAIVSSMRFERTRLSSELSGTPQNALESINASISNLQTRLTELDAESERLTEKYSDTLKHMFYSLARINRNHEIRRNAVCTEKSFYICGWIPEEDLPELTRVIETEASDTIVEEEPSLMRHIKPPTELKNPGVFKFFEILVKMYGLPAYDEIDPTIFVAITYFLMFGIMFGDVGQGLIILFAGLVLLKSKFSLAGVFACAGVSSVVSGLIYGSFFGNEEILPNIYGNLFGTPGTPLRLIAPMEDTMSLLIGGVAIGTVFMLGAAVINIINGLREKNLARALFDRNGAAGTLFYWIILLTAVLFIINGSFFLPVVLLASLAAIMFLTVFFKEPLERLLIERKSFLPDEKGLFFVQGFFEMVETLLSMASNTLSFIRVGAFALNHVGLFMAFNILSKMAGGAGGIFVQLFANALIIGLEGLIVGIQCLRLEYYELFSKFYKGDGKTYRPLSRNIS